jgi:hypothetical protein
MNGCARFTLAIPNIQQNYNQRNGFGIISWGRIPY